MSLSWHCKRLTKASSRTNETDTVNGNLQRGIVELIHEANRQLSPRFDLRRLQTQPRAPGVATTSLFIAFVDAVESAEREMAAKTTIMPISLQVLQCRKALALCGREVADRQSRSPKQDCATLLLPERTSSLGKTSYVLPHYCRLEQKRSVLRGSA